jgi:cysteine desulfurase
MRSGTLPTHQIVGMGEAFRLAREEMVEENKRIGKLRDKLFNGLSDIEAVYVNGDLDKVFIEFIQENKGLIDSL